MPLTHDGLQTALPPNRLAQVVGAALVVAPLALWGTLGGACVALPVALVGALVVVNQLNSTSRARVTTSKLLIEDERWIMGFLVGPSKRRMAYKDLSEIEVANGQIHLRDGKGDTLSFGAGCTDQELESVKERIETARDNWARDQG